MRPLEYLKHEEVKRMVQGYLAYLNDVTSLISNPGILVSNMFMLYGTFLGCIMWYTRLN
jgi:hypothetical protein